MSPPGLLGDRFDDQDFVRVGTDKDGYPVLMAWSRIDPYGPLTDIMREMLNGDPDISKLGDKLLDLYVAPRIVPQIYKALEATFDKGQKVSRTPLVQQLFPESYSEVVLDAGRAAGVDSRIIKAWTNALEAMFAPGITTSWRDSNSRVTEQDAAGAGIRAMSYSGFTFQSLNPHKPVTFGAMDYSNAIKYARRDIKEYFNDNPNRSFEEIAGELGRQRRAEKEAYDHAREVYMGALAAGMSARDANGLLKSTGLTADAMSAVIKGEFRSFAVSDASFKSSMEMELRRAPRSEHAEIRAKWRNMEQALTRVERAMTY